MGHANASRIAALQLSVAFSGGISAYFVRLLNVHSGFRQKLALSKRLFISKQNVLRPIQIKELRYELHGVILSHLTICAS